MKRKFNNPNDFDKLLKALEEEVGLANVYFRLYKDLKSSIHHYQSEFNQSNTFWFLTLSSLLDTSLLRLCRIYDFDPRVNSLFNLLNLIKENLDIFDEKKFRERLKDNPFVDSLAKYKRKPEQKQLDLDIQFVSKDSNKLVENLFMWRNNIIAHKSSKYIIKELNYISDYPLSFSDIDELLTKGMSIINRYSHLFWASTYSPQIVGYDDYKYILSCISDDLKRREKEFQAELEKYGNKK